MNEVTIIISNGIWVNKTFITLGDSITWQDGKAYFQGDVGAIARGYQTIMIEKLGFSSCHNRGVSGRPMADGSVNGAGNVTTGLAINNYMDYDLVIIAAGTNDFKLNIPLGVIGKIGDTEFDRSTYCGAYQTLIEHILTNSPMSRVVLFTPLQRDHDGYNSWDTVNTAKHKLIDYRNAIKKIGEMYALPVCDLYATSGFNKFTLSTYTMDGLHPNDEGYSRMGESAVHFLKTI